jgi:hypothetical protein
MLEKIRMRGGALNPPVIGKLILPETDDPSERRLACQGGEEIRGTTN